MAERRLSPDEAALWRRVMAGVRPLEGPRPVAAPAVPSAAPTVQVTKAAPVPPLPARHKSPKPPAAVATLDGGWDRRLSRGLVSPDRTVDLHGHGLQSAYHLLDDALGSALAAGDRVILLITGKPPARESERPHKRGAIRAAVGDWLAASRHGDRIAAVRGAHPRHGGTGALYIVLRRVR